MARLSVPLSRGSCLRIHRGISLREQFLSHIIHPQLTLGVLHERCHCSEYIAVSYVIQVHARTLFDKDRLGGRVKSVVEQCLLQVFQFQVASDAVALKRPTSKTTKP